ncbi:iron-sulfur cluster carrier protein ApbC [Bordetella petrii]|uniref:Iron-sulfur cluster carrier protein n=1 Tax=Bordetella petrii (strain ATCC BAA-461 / DSM 12804 / CCUG 43448 / CIP 107267 / Se-1111R) TaxID=340100 RepID=A9I7S3_BORPD|nr:iron-sulfur cluster carrier protein ApbC [Bordetella petrii]CAP44442.1 putative iron sulfur binding protein [Bordetella petrii]
MSITTAQVRAALRAVTDPFSGRELASFVKDSDILLDGAAVTVTAILGYPAGFVAGQLEDAARQALAAAGLPGAQVTVQWSVAAHAVQRGLKPLPTVRNIIAVASGKGGVGKSTTAVNLALALAADGAHVGILDADIYGPSVPTMLGISGRPASHDNKTMEPLQGHGLQANSIGFLIDADAPAIWRGPMVTQAFEQMLRQTNWRDLDYLVIDMPPGTGDLALTLAQKVPVVGAVIVTTPQDLALQDARKGLRMFQKVDVPILGIVENMAVHICSQCGHAEHIFGEGGGQRMAAQYQAPWLGSLPLALDIREQADAGRPSVVADPDGEAARRYRDIARKLAAGVAALPRDMAGRLPPVVVQPPTT